MNYEKEGSHKGRHFKHESKEGIIDEAFEHEPEMHKQKPLIPRFKK